MIAGFTIGISFADVHDPDVQEALQRFLDAYYHKTLFKKTPSSAVHFTISFRAEEEIKTIAKRHSSSTGSAYYIEAFSLSQKKAQVNYHIGIVQFQFLLKIILQKLLEKHEEFLFHASAVVDGDAAHLFLGKNGAGKSTIASGLQPYFIPFADDTVAIKREQGIWYMYQIPLEKNNKIAFTGSSKKITSLNILRKKPETRIRKLPKSRIIPTALSQLIQCGLTKTRIEYTLRFSAEISPWNIIEFPKEFDQKIIYEGLTSI